MSSLLLVLATHFAFDLMGADWSAVPARCLPGIDAVDWRAETQGEMGVIIWWCEDERHGLREHSRVSQRGADAVQRLLRDAHDAAFIIDSAPFRLRPTADDALLVADMRRRYTPLCKVTGALATDSTGAAVGELRLGQRLACGGLHRRDDAQVCHAIGAPQPDGTLLPADSWIPCEIQPAPHEGWEL